MSVFQLAAILVIVVMLLLSGRGLFRQARLITSLFWVTLWLATLIAVIYPDQMTELAKTVGIRRGADLLLYSAVLAFIAGFYLVSVRLRHMSREITVLTREVALLEAERAKDGVSPRQA